MQLAVSELYTFGKNLFPDNEFVTYVPPSNVLCPQERKWLPRVLPNLKVIASVYLEDENGMAYQQEFMEAWDGIIELPRVSSGFDPDEYTYWAVMNELALHYVNSHFFHPDDVIRADRGGDKGWLYLRGKYEEFVKWISEAAPGLRNMTAQEGAMAIQRYDRLKFHYAMRSS